MARLRLKVKLRVRVRVSFPNIQTPSQGQTEKQIPTVLRNVRLQFTNKNGTAFPPQWFRLPFPFTPTSIPPKQGHEEGSERERGGGLAGSLKS